MHRKEIKKTYRCRHELSRIGSMVAGVMLSALVVCSGVQAAEMPALHLADAVRMALSKNRDVLVQETYVDSYQGQYMQAAGQFDFVLSSDANYSRLMGSPLLGLDDTKSYTAGYEVGASKLLRNGMTAGVSLGTANYHGGLPTDAHGREATLGLTLVLPLLRGRGAAEVAAVEDAARLRVQASRDDLRTQISQVLYQTLVAYWTYRVREALLQAAVSSEDRSRSMLASNQKLVEASEKPRGDLVLLRADLADKIVVRQAAALALNDARSALGRLLGLNAAETGALPAPADPLPAATDMRALDDTQLAALRADALARRTDLRSLQKQLEGAERLTQSARDGLRPRVDLEVGVSYNKGLAGGEPAYQNLIGRNLAGPSVTARLNYQFPVANRTARGVLLERSAQQTELMISQRDLASAVTSAVDSALQAVLSGAEQLNTAQEGLLLYEQAVNQEIVKQKNGISTLIDVINVETRFVNARINALQAQLAYATAIARLRLETNTLLPTPSDPDADVDRFALDMGALGGLGPLEKQLSIAR